MLALGHPLEALLFLAWVKEAKCLKGFERTRRSYLPARHQKETTTPDRKRRYSQQSLRLISADLLKHRKRWVASRQTVHVPTNT